MYGGLNLRIVLYKDLVVNLQKSMHFSFLMHHLHTQLSGEIASITEQLKVLDDLKMAAAKDSMGEAAAGGFRPLPEICTTLWSMCLSLFCSNAE